MFHGDFTLEFAFSFGGHSTLLKLGIAVNINFINNIINW